MSYMILGKNVFFTLYKGNDLTPVTVYKEKAWTLESGVSIHVSIIGKSHRMVCQANGKSLTEFIAYPIPDQTPNPLDHFLLKVGETHNKKYREGDFSYHVNIRVVPWLFEDMEKFLDSLNVPNDLEILHHGFENMKGAQTDKAFTGIAVDLSASKFYTVHTYPENRFSILSRSEICCPVTSAAP